MSKGHALSPWAVLLTLGALIATEARGQVGWSPAMASRMQSGYRLSTRSERVAAEGYVMALKSGASDEVLGSATRICETRGDRARDYFLTAYHVIDSKPRPQFFDGAEARLEMADSAMDLALLSTPRRSDAPCLRIAESLLVAEVYDIEGAANSNLFPVQIEALNVNEWAASGGDIRRAMEQRTLETVIVAARSYGMAAHTAAGPLLMINALGLPGMSGGAVMAWMIGQEFSIPTGWQLNLGTRELRRARRTLVGLIKATDRDGRVTALIAGPVIAARLKLFFEGGIGTRVTERNAADHVELLDSGAFLYPSHRLFSASVARLYGAGTGRLADGGYGAEIRSRASGLVFPNQPQRVWLSVGNLWTEFDPVDIETRQRLRNRRQLDGIYEEGGHLMASRGQTPLPDWLALPVLTTLPDDHRIDLSESERFDLYHRRSESARSCLPTLATVRREGSEDLVGGVVIVCQRDVTDGKTMTLIATSARNFFASFAVRLDLRRQCRPQDTPCPLELKARWRPLNARFPFTERETWLAWTERFLSSWSDTGAVPLSRRGLRSFWSEGAVQGIHLERLGGYRIRVQGRDGVYIVSGPTGDILSAAQQELTSPARTLHLVQAFQQALRNLRVP